MGKFPELNHVFVSLSSFVIFHLTANKKLLDTGGVPWCSSVEKPEFVHLIFLPPSHTKIVVKLCKFCDNDDDGSGVGKHGAVLYCLQSSQTHFASLCPFPFTISIFSNQNSDPCMMLISLGSFHFFLISFYVSILLCIKPLLFKLD